MKNPEVHEHGKIYLHDIGDYLTQAEKLEKISAFGSIKGITAADGWQAITPDAHNDWVGLRDDSFSGFISMGDKKDKDSKVVFANFSLGLASGRDAWVYNSSKSSLIKNMQRMTEFYNSEVKRYNDACNNGWSPEVESFINSDDRKISWNRNLKNDLSKKIKHFYRKEFLTSAIYRPFTKTNLYFSKEFSAMLYQIPRIFPNSSVENRVICVTGRGATKEFCAFMADTLPDLEMVSKGQCFPMHLYEPAPADESNQPSGLKPQGDLFSNAVTGVTTDLFEQAATTPRYTSRDGITDAGLAHFQAAYPTETISKEDLFYYIYGLLHSEDYKAKYADNLTKELPRIPAVKQAADFWHFSTAGRELAELHVNYETQAKYPVTLDCGSRKLAELQDKDFYVAKMKFASKSDKSTVVYNHAITIKGIPLAAYDYVVNGKPALEWVMERQGVSTHKDRYRLASQAF